ncbi:MAG: hypothetical protein LBP78_00005, partial [Acidaminococcales bacterium]|nr:hypothetical protein [Acidaminococcales bacterium]
MTEQNKRKYGSPVGFLITVAIGFAFYIVLPLIPSMHMPSFAYKNIIDGIGSDAAKQFLWFMINWTEADFTAGAISSIMVIVGGVIAWQLAVKGSVKRGFSICYGSSHTWPWVLAAQAGALLLNMYLFGYLFLLGHDGVSWVATFIVLVSTPSALMLTYGPSVPTLLTAIILPASMSAPISYWLSKTLLPMLQIPGGVCNVLSMALAGFAVMAVCRVLPW